MADVSTLFKPLELKLKEVLLPLVGQADHEIRQIDIMPLLAPEQLPEFLHKHRSRLPGAFLSFPEIGAPRRTDPLVDLQLGYALLVGLKGRERISQQVDLAYVFTENLFRELAGRRLDARGLGAQLDYLRVTGASFSEVENAQGAPISTLFLTFDLGVRNWRVN